MKNKFKLFFVFATVAGLILMASANSLPSAHAAGPWYVSNSGNDSNDCASTTTTCASINGALNKPGFVASDTIYVAIGTYTGSGTEVVLLNKSATLSGGWNASFTTQSGMSTIDGQGTRRGITMSSGAAVTIERFVVQNGSSYYGGGIRNSGTLTVTRSILQTNVTSSDGYDPAGGGIWNDGTLNVTNSTISGNRGYDDGGGIVSRGGGIWNNGPLNIMDSTLSGNSARSGGGISNDGSSTLNITNSTISGNSAASSGGIYNSSIGTLNITNSTISGNRANNYGGGGIYHTGVGPLNITNSTISGNSASEGGGIRAYYVLYYPSFRNTIVANNTADVGSNCIGTIANGGTNIDSGITCGWGSSNGSISNTDPMLAPLGNYGGSTQTMSLLAGSPAIDMANLGYCPSADQRGFPRFGNCDIGAFELQPIEFANKIVNKSNALIGDPMTYTVSLTNGGSTPLANVRITDTLPIEVTYINSSLTATSGSPSYAGGTVAWNGSIAAGGSATITFGTTINTSVSAGTIITNSAVINGGGEIFTRTATTNVINRFASANKSVNKTSASLGDSLNYTIVFTMSNGIAPATVLVTDTLPSQLSYIPSSLSSSSGNPSYSGGVITWNGTAPAGSTVTINFGAKVNQSGNIVNSAIINSAGEIITRTATTNVNRLTYLPFVNNSRLCRGICGRVTYNGNGASGVPLYLRFYNGSSWSTLATGATDPSGNYAFTSVPSLSGGQLYYVLFTNSANSALLSLWKTRQLTSYTASSNVVIGDFDLANVYMTSPAPGTTVSLPYTFQWNVRPATSSDSYEFNLYHSSGAPYWSTVPPLGYAGSYTLNSLPADFNPSIWYRWYVAVRSPDGGYGESYYVRDVMFSNTGSAPQPKMPTNPQNIPENLPGQPRSRQVQK
jgi:uncharacterized repeat protein (TIGR01451 family)